MSEALPAFAELLLRRRPRVVVVLGSATSTVAAAAALQRCGGGRVIAVEHDPARAASTSAELARRGLERIAVVRRAALIGGSFEPAILDDVARIDVLLVKGTHVPPFLAERVRPEGVVLLGERA